MLTPKLIILIILLYDLLNLRKAIKTHAHKTAYREHRDTKLHKIHLFHITVKC